VKVTSVTKIREIVLTLSIEEAQNLIDFSDIVGDSLLNPHNVYATKADNGRFALYELRRFLGSAIHKNA